MLRRNGFRIGQTGLRYKSILNLPAKTAIDPDSIYVISIPITNLRSYVHCHHRPSLLHESQRDKYPLATKIEAKLIALATKGWDKLVSSDWKINKNIVYYIKKLLATIPYQEGCLKSFPSKAEMIRVVKGDQATDIALARNPNGDTEISDADAKAMASATAERAQTDVDTPSITTIEPPLPPNVLQGSVTELNIPPAQLQRIPFYHPSFQQPCAILDQLYHFRDTAHATYRRNAIWCAIGIPLTLPFALVPVVPNVPCFYLCYRLYCNWKALEGVKNMDYLLETAHPIDPKESKKSVCEILADDKLVADTTHLSFKPITNLDKIYTLNNTEEELAPPVQAEEKVLINEEIIDVVTKRLNVPKLKEDLMKAMHQEQKRLDNEVEHDVEVK
ncbi:hypothetical protein DICA1_A08108 [Diutina catenulata]